MSNLRLIPYLLLETIIAMAIIIGGGILIMITKIFSLRARAGARTNIRTGQAEVALSTYHHPDQDCGVMLLGTHRVVDGRFLTRIRHAAEISQQHGATVIIDGSLMQNTHFPQVVAMHQREMMDAQTAKLFHLNQHLSINNGWRVPTLEAETSPQMSVEEEVAPVQYPVLASALMRRLTRFRFVHMIDISNYERFLQRLGVSSATSLRSALDALGYHTTSEVIRSLPEGKVFALVSPHTFEFVEEYLFKSGFVKKSHEWQVAIR